MKRKLLILGIIMSLVFSVIALTGCGSDSDDKKAEGDKQVLKVGLDDTFAPMGFRDEAGNLVGFDIDLANAVAEELGMEVEFKPINWDAKDMELKSKNIDCIWNGMSQTPEREEAMSLSKKYLNNKIVLMTMKDDVKVENAQDMAKYKLGTQADSAALEMMQKNEAYDSFKDNITEYKSYDDAILDMKAGRVDVIVIDQVLGEYKNSKMDDALKTLEYSLGDDYYVIGFRKEDTSLRDDVNNAIEKLIKDGKAKKISEKWFGKDIMVFE